MSQELQDTLTQVVVNLQRLATRSSAANLVGGEDAIDNLRVIRSHLHQLVDINLAINKEANPIEVQRKARHCLGFIIELTQFPAVFSFGTGASVIEPLIFRIMPFLCEPRHLSLHPLAIRALESLLILLSHTDFVELQRIRTFFQESIILLCDLFSLLRVGLYHNATPLSTLTSASSTTANDNAASLDITLLDAISFSPRTFVGGYSLFAKRTVGSTPDAFSVKPSVEAATVALSQPSPSILFDVSTAARCVALQIGIMSLVERLLVRLPQFIADHLCRDLWDVCLSLNTAPYAGLHPRLTVSSLQLMTALVVHVDDVSDRWRRHDDVIRCLVGLLRLYSANGGDTTKASHSVTTTHEVDDALARCLATVMRHFPSDILRRAASEISQAASQRLASAIKGHPVSTGSHRCSTALKQTLIDTFTALLRLSPDDRTLFDVIERAIVSLLGKPSIKTQVRQCLQTAIASQLRHSGSLKSTAAAGHSLNRGRPELAGPLQRLAHSLKRKGHSDEQYSAGPSVAMATTEPNVRTSKRRRVGDDGRAVDTPYEIGRTSQLLDGLLRKCFSEWHTDTREGISETHAVAMATVVPLCFECRQHCKRDLLERLLSKIGKLFDTAASDTTVSFSLKSFDALLDMAQAVMSASSQLAELSPYTAVLHSASRVCALPWQPRPLPWATAAMDIDGGTANGAAAPPSSPELVGVTVVTVENNALTNAMCRCIELLARFAEIPDRTRIFSEAVCDRMRPAVAACAVRWMSTLIVRIGREHNCASQLLASVLSNASNRQQQSYDVLLATAQHSGQLACVFLSTKKCEPVATTNPPEVHCLQCSETKCAEMDSNEGISKPPHTAIAAWQRLCDDMLFSVKAVADTSTSTPPLGGHADDKPAANQLRVAFLEKSFPRIVRHILSFTECSDDVRRYFTEIWQRLVVADDKAVRHAVAGAASAFAVSTPQLQQLFAAVEQASAGTSDSAKRETLVYAMGQLGRVCEEPLLLRIIDSLLESLVDNALAVRAAAHDALSAIASAKRFAAAADLLSRHAEHVFPFLVDKLLTVPHFVDEVASSLFDTDAAALLESTLGVTLPYLVSKGDAAQVVPALQAIASRLTASAKLRAAAADDTLIITPAMLIIANISRLLPRVLLDGAAVELLETLCKEPIATAVCGCLYETLLQLIVELGSESAAAATNRTGPVDGCRSERAKNAMLRLFELAAPCLPGTTAASSASTMSTAPSASAPPPSMPAVSLSPRDDKLVEFLSSQFFGIVEAITNSLLDRKRSPPPSTMSTPSAAAAMPADVLAALAPQRMLSLHDKERILAGFDAVLRLIRPELAKLRPKVMATLRLIMRQAPALVPAVADVWYTFVTNLDAAHLGASLVAIVVDLLPYLESCPEKVARVLRHLFIERRDALWPFFSEVAGLYIPDVPALADVRTAIENAVGNRNSGDTRAQIAMHMRGVQQSATDNVRNHALRKLSQVLHTCQPEIVAMALTDAAFDGRQSQTTSPLLSDLLRVLLICGRDSSTSTRQRIAECLGEIGAVDPGRVDIVGLRPDLPEDKSDDELAVELVRDHLVKALLRNDPRVQDRAAYAIQEILRFCGCTTRTAMLCEELDSLGSTVSTPAAAAKPGKRGSGGSSGRPRPAIKAEERRPVEIWRKFPEDVRELITPFLSSVYTMSRPPAAQPPFYPNAGRGTSRYAKWVCSWTAYLIGRSKGSKLAIFSACLGITLSRSDTSVARYLLPYVLLNVLRYGTEEDRNWIKKEMIAVLEDAAGYAGKSSSSGHSGPSPNPAAPAVSTVTESAASVWSMAGAVDGAGVSLLTPSMSTSTSPQDASQLCTQTVFTLIDLLTRWAEQQKQKDMRAANAVNTAALPTARATREASTRATAALDAVVVGNRPHTPVEKVLQDIPPLLVAMAAFRCKAYARAYMYFEIYLRIEIKKAAAAMATAGLTGSAIMEAARREVLTAPNLAAFLRIYAGTDEPDGLAGISYWLRQVSSNTMDHLEEHIVELTKNGNWSDALVYHDHALQQQLQLSTSAVAMATGLTTTQTLTARAQHQIGMLKCLRNLGQFETMLAVVKGQLALNAASTVSTSTNGPSSPRKRQWTHTMNAFGVQASWRLGRWDLLEEFLENIRTSASPSLDDGVSAPFWETFEIAVGRILCAMKHGREQEAVDILAKTRVDVMLPLLAAGMDSYRRAYPYMVKLHMLRELEQALPVVVGVIKQSGSPLRAGDGGSHKLFADWSGRLQISQYGVKFREPILTLRRAILSLLDLKCDIAELWMTSATVYRKAGHFQSAASALVQAAGVLAAAGIHGNTAGVATAKLKWTRGDRHGALVQITEEISRFSPPVPLVPATRSGCSGGGVGTLLAATENGGRMTPAQQAECLVLAGKWMQQTGHSSHEVIKTYLTDAVKLDPHREKSHFGLGKYWDATLLAVRKAAQEANVREATPLRIVSASRAAGSVKTALALPDFIIELGFVVKAVSSYGKSLCLGHRYIYQSLPRLLTLWCDYGAAWITVRAAANSGSPSGSAAEKLQRKQLRVAEELMTQLRKEMSLLVSQIAPYQWLTAFSQLTSRICHRNREHVFDLLRSIILSVLTTFPQQAMWAMAALMHSSISVRAQRAQDVFAEARSRIDPAQASVLTEGALLTKHLIDFTNLHKDTTEKISVIFLSKEKECRELRRMLPTKAIVPLQSSLTVSLPDIETLPAAFTPFAADLPTIADIRDEVPLMVSLQRPKKVTFVGSDGREYVFLAKPKDDLRKDARMMELNAVINKLLKRSPEGRSRALHVRTYAVVPLNEEVGLIQWVPDTTGLKHILTPLYQSEGITLSTRDIRTLIEPLQKAVLGKGKAEGGADLPAEQAAERLRAAFADVLLPSFPPVFYKWFLSTFPDPARWFDARLAYTRTAAVMSIIGYIVGLGDRHGENLLMDSTTGECVHVDLNCLFWKGLTFTQPEMVPFRLTPNMVDALGLTKVEGTFRKVCEITLGTLRANRDTLMSVLEPFVYDPLVEWRADVVTPSSRSHRRGGAAVTPSAPADGEVENELAMQNLTKIDNLLQGLSLDGRGMSPLSVEGQVHQQIAQAVDVKNLSRMYIGWCAWL